MDVPATTPAEDRIERAEITVNAYQVFWDSVEGDDLLAPSPPPVSEAADAYAQFWIESDR